MIAYLSGPMRGYPQLNFPAFNDAEETLRMRGIDVINPARSFGGRSDLSLRHYMRVDTMSLLMADCVYVLPGWERSEGARYGVLIAQNLALPIYEYETRNQITKRVSTSVQV